MSVSGYAVISGNQVKTIHNGCRSFGSVKELFQQTAESFRLALPEYKKIVRSGDFILQSVCAVGAALLDAGITAPLEQGAILGIGKDGAHRGNLLYWSDYVANGRHDGQGRLFVGTLPSTPVCEAAIIFGIHGTAYYLTPGENEMDVLTEETGLLFREGFSPVILLNHDNGISRCIVLNPDNDTFERDLAMFTGDEI